MGNDKVAMPTVGKPSTSTVDKPNTATVEQPVVTAVDDPQPPKVPGDVAAQSDGTAPAARRRQSTDKDRPRTTVTSMVVNLDAERVALVAMDGPPYRGDIATDLSAGVYVVRPDPRQHLWIFEPNQVRQGLRFDLTIDGPDPFSLTYSTPLLLLVGHGLDGPRSDTLARAVATINAAVYDSTPQRYADALAYLCLMNDVDLYDLLDEMWATKPELVNALLLNLPAAAKLSDAPGQLGVLRALESFARKPSELFVDGFDSCQVSPKSFSKDEERARAGLTNIQLVLSYDLIPPRALIVYADDITDDTTPDPNPPTYGPLGLTYPTVLSLGNTPKLHAAKKAAVAQIETQNAEFFTTAFKLVAQVLLGVYQASLSVANLDRVSASRGYQPRAERGPGQWRDTFEGGSNMSPEAEAYENSSCGTPPGMGYYVDNVQFEGFKAGKLVDAKYWFSKGQIGKFIRDAPWIAEEKIANQATRQLAVANKYGVGVQWRVADPQMADMLRNFMQYRNLPVEIVYIAP